MRRSRHGLTAAEINDLIALQHGCAVCHRMDKPLQIDHDHHHCPGTVGCRLCVRGALCARCNRAVLDVNDNPELARSLFDYLVRTAAR